MRKLTSLLENQSAAYTLDANLTMLEDHLGYYAEPDSGSTGAPAGGSHELHELWIDSGCNVWRCTVAGTPGTWELYIPSDPVSRSGAHTITGLWTFSRSTNAPFAVNSGSAKVTNLDADKLDGYDTATAATASTVAVRDASGNLTAASPTDTAHLATKGYVDATAQGLRILDPCRVATIANITLSGTQTIDGVSVVADESVLVKNQSTASQNGVYLCKSGSWTRRTDADSTAELDMGAYVAITEGTVNGGSSWVQQTDNPTVGTSDIVWKLFATNTTYSAGTGISIVGTTISLGSHSHSGSDITSGTVGASYLASHDLVSKHTTTCTTGQFLKATGTNTFAWAAHGITYADVGAAASSHTHLWVDITDKPSTFTPSSHNHSGSDITSGTVGASYLASHDLVSKHTTTCTTGQFLKATGTNTFAWASHGLTYTDVGAAASSHAHSGSDITSGSVGAGYLASHDLVSKHTTTCTTGQFLKATGTNTFAWASHGLTYADVGAASSSHSHSGVYQPADAFLTSIAALGTAADRMIYTTAVDTAAECPLTSAARDLLDDASSSAMRSTLGISGTTNSLCRFTSGGIGDSDIMSDGTTQTIGGATDTNVLSGDVRLRAYSSSLAYFGPRDSLAGTDIGLVIRTQSSGAVVDAAKFTSAGSLAVSRSLRVGSVDGADPGDNNIVAEGLVSAATYLVAYSGVLNRTGTSAGGVSHYYLQDAAGVNYWTIGLLGAESTGNAGADLAWYAWDDVGGFLATRMLLYRSNGDLRIVNLTGTGDRMVVAGSTGILAAQDAATARSTIGAAASSHTHSGSDITSGTVGASYLASHDLVSKHTTTCTSGQFLKATGTNTFAWAAHGLTYTDVGAAASSHAHSGSDITSGTVGANYLASHDLVSKHTTTCTSGQFLKATGTNTFAWAAHGLTYTDVGAAASSHSHSGSDITSGTVGASYLANHDLVSKHTTTCTSGQFLKATGTNTFAWAAHGLTYNDVGAASSSHTHDSTYLKLTGGTITGLLTLSASDGELMALHDTSNTVVGWIISDGTYWDNYVDFYPTIYFSGGLLGIDSRKDYDLLLNSQGGGNVGIGVTDASARLHLPAGGTGTGAAPLKFTSGSLLSIAEPGAMEWDGNNLYITLSGPTRKLISIAGHTHLWADITDKPSTFTPSSHTHSAADITSGTLAIARGGTNQTSFTNQRAVFYDSTNGYLVSSTSVAVTHDWLSVGSSYVQNNQFTGANGTTVFGSRDNGEVQLISGSSAHIRLQYDSLASEMRMAFFGVYPVARPSTTADITSVRNALISLGLIS